MATTITVQDTTLERFNQNRPEQVDSADEFINVLLDVYDGEFDYDTEAIYERISALEDIAGANNLQREDMRLDESMVREIVREEVRKALRDTLQ